MSRNIGIDENTDSYQLKFNIVSYNQETIFLGFDMPLENCKSENNILTCSMTKNDLLTYFSPQDKEGYIFYRNEYNYPIDFKLVHKIEISKKNLKKEIFP